MTDRICADWQLGDQSALQKELLDVVRDQIDAAILSIFEGPDMGTFVLYADGLHVSVFEYHTFIIPWADMAANYDEDDRVATRAGIDAFLKDEADIFDS